MQKYLTIKRLVLLVLAIGGAQASCVKAANVNQASQPSLKGSECETWQQMVSKISSSQKATLQREGVVPGQGGLILDETLVTDCDLRVRIGVYLRQVMDGIDKRPREFAAKHSKEIVAVLRRIWPSLSNAQSWAVDGAAHEKYLLLSDPHLDGADVAPLIDDILQKEGINIDLVAVIFRRPLVALKPAISQQVDVAAQKRGIPQQIYGLALLQSLGDQTALARLRVLSKNEHLSALERKLIPALVAKIERNEELKLSDVEELEYRNDRQTN